VRIWLAGSYIEQVADDTGHLVGNAGAGFERVEKFDHRFVAGHNTDV